MPNLSTEASVIKHEITHDGTPVLAINLSYPTFSGENEKTLKRLNDFYKDLAFGFFDFCKQKHAPLLVKGMEKGKAVSKNGATMSWYLSHCNGRLASVICDLSYFDGTTKRSERLVHNWDMRDGCPCRACEVFEKSRFAKNLYCEEISSKIENGEGKFDYYEDAPAIAKKHFDFDKFYLTPKGVAFFYDRNILFRSDVIYPAFVIPFAEVEGLTKYYQN